MRSGVATAGDSIAAVPRSPAATSSRHASPADPLGRCVLQPPLAIFKPPHDRQPSNPSPDEFELVVLLFDESNLEVLMPAITVDTLTLPRVPAATLGDTERAVRSITTGLRGFEGEGFPVVRAFAGVSSGGPRPVHPSRSDGRGPLRVGEPKGTVWHPHRGFETVTYMIDGQFEHRFPRRRWDDRERRYPVDDGRCRHPALETPAGEAGQSGGLFHGASSG